MSPQQFVEVIAAGISLPYTVVFGIYSFDPHRHRVIAYGVTETLRSMVGRVAKLGQSHIHG